MRFFIALPAHAKRCRRAWRMEFISALPVGFAMNRRGLELRELLPLIPAEKLLIETDAPYLLPRDLTPKPSSRRNEPAHLPHILQRIAHWRGEDAAWLAATTDANVKTLFGIAF
nr:yigW protein - Escherichia coli (strain K-12) [Escherichia coli]AAA67637.1 o113 [Escherichia coli str. K-12 substr. MG1655]